MNLPYIKLFADSAETIDMLSDAEAGRLLKSLLRYASDKEVNLSGNERFVFGMLKAQMDRDAAGYQAYLDKQRANGMRGGRPRKNPENPPVSDKNPENPRVFQETQKSLNKEVCVDIDGTTDIDGKYINTHTKQQQADTRARAREGWFDPANPDSPDDGAWKQSPAARKAIAQRLINYGCQKMTDTHYQTEAGVIGTELFDALVKAMEIGISPQVCMEQAQGCGEVWQWEYAIKKEVVFTGGTRNYPDWYDQIREVRDDMQECG